MRSFVTSVFAGAAVPMILKRYIYTHMYLYFFKFVICCALYHHWIFRRNCSYCFYRFLTAYMSMQSYSYTVVYAVYPYTCMSIAYDSYRVLSILIQSWCTHIQLNHIQLSAYSYAVVCAVYPYNSMSIEQNAFCRHRRICRSNCPHHFDF